MCTDFTSRTCTVTVKHDIFTGPVPLSPSHVHDCATRVRVLVSPAYVYPYSDNESNITVLVLVMWACALPDRRHMATYVIDVRVRQTASRAMQWSTSCRKNGRERWG